jgi:serine/threonine protein kinase
VASHLGQQIGNYRILRGIGRGGQAEVYLGEHVYLGSYAALKVLRATLSDEQAERFLAEARTLVRLSHPHIVRVLDFTVEQGSPVLIMEYAPDGTLRTRHPLGSCLPLTTVVSYVKQVAAALQYAHTRNVIHRDVKPENLLLGSQGQILLSDFGLSLLLPSTELLSGQEMAGTLPYMAPEQLRGKPSFASDQYALAVMVYEWLSGTRPFVGPLWQIAQQHLSAAPVLLREKVASLPEEVEGVVHRALSKDPQKRFVSVQSFAHALARASRENANDLSSLSQSTVPLVVDTPSPMSTIMNGPLSQRVVLFAAPADEAFALRLQTDLEARGVSLFWPRSSESMKGPQGQREELRQALRAATLVLTVLSPRTRSSRALHEQMRLATLYERRMLFVWAEGSEANALLPSAQSWKNSAVLDVIDARGSNYETAVEEIRACLEEELPDSAVAEVTRPMLRGQPRNPYKGLRAFTGNDTADFFGREALIQELEEALEGMFTSERHGTPHARLLTVTGASGSGKSSVVLAGLLPRLQSGTLPESQEWVYLNSIVPGSHPLEALALSLSPHFPERSLKSLYEDLEDDSARGLHLLASRLTRRAGTRVVLLVDQFEEVFTQSVAEEERQRFIDLLVTAATEAAGPLLVLLTLRADFSDRPLAYPALGRLIQQNQHVVFPMELEDLREVIEGPAALPDVQLTFEGNLVGDLLFEAQGQAGALPLLEFTLDQLFQRREGQRLTLRAYQQIGGVKGALARQAESTYATLPSEEHRRLARALFLRLINPGVSEQDTRRRRAVLTELVLTDSRQTAMLREVTDAFVSARLLTTNETAGVTTVEVSHEALIREWTRLSDWLREAREHIHLQQAVSEDAAEWERRGKPKDRLYRGSQLKEAQLWAQQNIPNSQEEHFLQASAAHRLRVVLSLTAILLLLVSSMGLALWLFLLPPSYSTVVTTLESSGPGSLRQAITVAKPGDTITFAPTVHGTLQLTSDGLGISKNLTIRGPGADRFSISGGNSNHIVHVLAGASVHMTGVTFRDSQTRDKSILINDGTLVLEDSKISGNSTEATSGSAEEGSFAGGITNRGTLTLLRCSVVNNVSTGPLGQGGGITNSGTLTLISSTVTGNRASGAAGGLFNGVGAKATLLKSTIMGNTVSSTLLNHATVTGGGITNLGSLIVTESTIASNVVSSTGMSDSSSPPAMLRGAGGGIYSGGSLTLTNSTISDNTVKVEDQQRDVAFGGGIYIVHRASSGPTMSSITFSTIFGNTARDSGGGISIDSSIRRVSMEMRNSLVAGNHAATDADIAGVLSSDGYNLIQDLSGITFTPNQQHLTDVSVDHSTAIKIDPHLSGEAPQTHALLTGSPAIDRIPLNACHINGITTDQRGTKRPRGPACDIGAYEYVPSS